jgi:hypothetical protein
VESAVALTQELSELINNTDPNEASLLGLISKIKRIADIFHIVENQQIMNGCETVVDCENCLILLEELSGEFRNIVDSKTFGQYSQNYFASKVDKLRVEGGKCEVAIKSN